MKKILTAIALSIALPAAALAQATPVPEPKQSCCEKMKAEGKKCCCMDMAKEGHDMKQPDHSPKDGGERGHQH